MKALILAAGLGSRLKNNTKNLPKALVRVNKKPIIEYQINALMNNGINDIVVVVGKLGNKIIDFFKKYYPEINATFVTNDIYDKSNSSYSFWLARDYLTDDQYIHLNCDIIFSEELLKMIIENNKSNIIAIRTDINFTNQMENVVYDSHGRITRMGKSIYKSSKGKAYGLAKLNLESTLAITKKIQNYLNNNDKNQHCYGMIRELVDDLEYYAFTSDKHLLIEVNTEDDLQLANNFMKK